MSDQLFSQTVKSEDLVNLQQRLSQIKICLNQNQLLIDHYEEKRRLIQEELFDLEFSEGFDFQDEENENDAPDSCVKINFRSMSVFFKPYIRDRRGVSAPLPFARDPYEVIDTNLFLLLSSHRKNIVNENTKKIILAQVSSQHLEHASKEITTKLESLLKQHQYSCSNKGLPENVKLQIFELNNELLLMRSKKNLEPPQRWDENIDWLVVCKHLPLDFDAFECEILYNNLLHYSINKAPFSQKEEDTMVKLVENLSDLRGIWDKVAGELNTGRLAWQCFTHYQRNLNPHVNLPGGIAGNEATQINALVLSCKDSSLKSINWEMVKLLVETRSVNQIKGFWNKTFFKTAKENSSEDSTKFSRWSLLEDRIAIAGYKLYGAQWSKISHFLPTKNASQVRQRYLNKLWVHSLPDSEISLWGGFSVEEDILLTKVIKESLLSSQKSHFNLREIKEKYFPLRTEKQIYRRYKLVLRYAPEIFLDVYNGGNESTTQPSECDGPRCSNSFSPQPFQSYSKQRLEKQSEDSQKLFEVLCTLPRKSGNRERINYNIPSDYDDLIVFLEESREKLLKPVTQDDQTTMSFLNRHQKFHNLKVNFEKNYKKVEQDQEDDYRFIDYVLPMFHQLALLSHHVRKKTKFFLPLDIVSLQMCSLVMTEAIDPTTCCNRSLDHFGSTIACNDHQFGMGVNSIDFDIEKEKPGTDLQVLESEHDETDTQPSTYPPSSQLNIDLVRFYLSRSSVHLMGSNIAQGEPRSIVTPNYSTMFAYSMLSTLKDNLLYRLFQNVQTSDDDKEENTFEYYEQTIPEDPEFSELESMFTSLFLWPSIIFSHGDNESLKSNLLKRLDEPENENAQPPILQQPPKKLGRPSKRKFALPQNEFIQTRSIQAQIFMCQNHSDIRYQLDAFYESNNANSNQFWIYRDQHLFNQQAEHTLNLITDSCLKRLQQNKHKDKAKKKKKK